MTQRIGDKLIEHDQCEERLFADADFDESLLLLALAISRALREGHAAMERLRLVPVTAVGDDAERALSALARAERMLRLGPDPKNRDPHWRLRHWLKNDIPRYEVHPPTYGRCEAPMVKRTGACGQRTSNSVPVRSRDDGTLTWRFYCSRHRDWARELRRTSPSAAECPTPPCNTGGLLMRHFPNWDWLTLYRWAYGHGWESWKPPADAFPDVAGMWGGLFGVSA